jgi:hypothetical protein
MTLVSSVYIGSDTEFIFRGRRSFIYVMHSTDPRIYPWGIPHFNIPQSKKKFSVESVTLLQISVFYELNRKTRLSLHPLHTPWIQYHVTSLFYKNSNTVKGRFNDTTMIQAKLQDATTELHKMHFVKCFKQHVITWPAV